MELNEALKKLDEVKTTKAAVESIAKNIKDLRKRQIAFDRTAAKRYTAALKAMSEAVASSDISMHLDEIIDEIRSGDFSLGTDPFGEVLAEAKKRTFDEANDAHGDLRSDVGHAIYSEVPRYVNKVKKF